MENNDFLGSFAQENVSFTTKVIKTTSVGDNYWKVMIFIEDDRFVDTGESVWETIPGSSTCKSLSVSVSDYAEHTSGILQSWLYDLFCNGYTGDCILVTCGSHDGGDTPTSEGFIQYMEEAYSLMKAYAYHKTVCAAPTVALEGDFVLDTSVAVAFAQLCAGDKGLLSSAPYFPFTTSTPADPSTDALYMALKNVKADAFMSAYQDTTRNAALFSLGLAMSTTNGSGTCVGNSMDMTKTGMIACSGPSGTNLPKNTRTSLKNVHVQTFKPVGDNSGNVAAIGAETLNGDVVQATWILSYITYMVKVKVARMITEPNFLKNSSNYTKILNALSSILVLFGESGSGRLKNMSITAPGFGSIVSLADTIVIEDAWVARYVDQVRNVQLTGTLYIGDE